MAPRVPAPVRAHHQRVLVPPHPPCTAVQCATACLLHLLLRCAALLLYVVTLCDALSRCVMMR